MMPERSAWKLSYLPGSAQNLDVRVVVSWLRGDIDGMVMSASSGPKDYIKNQIYAAFQQVPAVEEIALMRAGGPAFLVLRAGGRYFDATAREISVTKVAE